MARRMLPNSPERWRPELVVLDVVGDHAAVDHHDLVVLLLIEKAELFEDDIGVAPVPLASGVDVAFGELAAEVVRQIPGVVERILADLVDDLLLLGGRRRRGSTGSAFAAAAVRGGKRGGHLAQVFERGDGLRACAEAAEVGDRLGVEAVGEANPLHRRRDFGVLVLLFDGGLDVGDELVDVLVAWAGASAATRHSAARSFRILLW